MYLSVNSEIISSLFVLHGPYGVVESKYTRYRTRSGEQIRNDKQEGSCSHGYFNITSAGRNTQHSSSDCQGAFRLRIAKGHFATNRCHVNYYVDMTYTKHRLAEAHEAAKELVRKMDKSSPIDSILCLEGTEVLGTCIAEELIQDGIRITNEHGTIYVVTPELTSSNQIIFRSNTAHLIRNRHVLILAASIATGARRESARSSPQGRNVQACQSRRSSVPSFWETSCAHPQRTARSARPV